MIDTTINVGHIITILIAASAAIGSIYMMKSDIRVFASQLASFKEILTGIQLELKNLSQVMIAQALTDQKLRDLASRVERLEARARGVNDL